MKKILITPRIDYIKKKNLIFFSIEKNWIDYVKKLNSTIFIFDYNNYKLIDLADVIIFSGGNDLTDVNNRKENIYREKSELKLLKLSIKKNKKIIGICKGFQLINKFYGGRIIKTKYHVNKDHNIYSINKNEKKVLNVNSYHNYKIKLLGSDLKSLYKTEDDSIEIAHKKNILCLMFHPERKNNDQKKIDKLLNNFINI